MTSVAGERAAALRRGQLVIVLGLFIGLNLAWLGFFRMGRREASRK